MSTHKRLQRSMRSPVRQARAGKHRGERARAYAAFRLPASALRELFSRETALVAKSEEEAA